MRPIFTIVGVLMAAIYIMSVDTSVLVGRLSVSAIGLWFLLLRGEAEELTCHIKVAFVLDFVSWVVMFVMMPFAP
jgi:hypothetical protein